VSADVYLYVDSGHEYYITTSKEKNFIYSIDSYQNQMELYNKGNYTRLSWWLYVRENVSMVFDAFMQGYQWFDKQGIKCIYISMGYDDSIFKKPTDLPKPYDILFIGGRKSEGLRGKILDIVGSHCKLYTPQTYNQGIMDAMAQCKTFLDIPPVESDMLGQRFYEGYAMEVPMISQERPTLLDFTTSSNSGIYTYTLWDLESSLKTAIDLALKASTSPASASKIERNTKPLTWNARVLKMLNYI
jgi:hypothetical protein